MIRIRKTIKRIAAISAMTLMGLSTVAIGAAAATTYAVGPTADAASTALLTAGGAAEGVSSRYDVVLGLGIAESGKSVFDSTLEDEDVAGLIDTEIAFQGTSYNVHDEIKFVSNGSSVETSLSSNEDDYADGVYLETASGRLGYYYVFDTSINTSAASTSEPLEINFLGQSMQITSCTSGEIFVTRLGTKKYVKVDEAVTVEGHTVTVRNVGSSDIIVDVDGTEYTVTIGTAQTIGTDFEIYVQSGLRGIASVAEGSAILWMGKDARETVTDADPFRGGDDDICEDSLTDMDCWVWDVGELFASQAGDNVDASGGVTIGVLSDFDVSNLDDGATGIGESLRIADGNIWINFEDLLNEEDPAKVTIELQTGKNLANLVNPAGTAVDLGSDEAVIYMSIDQDEGFEMTQATFDDLSTDARTSKIWIHANESTTNNTNIIYLNTQGQKVALDGINFSTSKQFAEIRYSDTKDTNVEFMLEDLGSGATASMNLILDIIDDESYITDGYDDITVVLGTAAHDFDAIGATPDQADTADITWANKGGTAKQIGKKDEDHRSLYGIVIKDSESYGDDDKVRLEIPKDNVKARISVTGSQVSAAVNEAKTPAEIESADITTGSILVGGPAANKYAAEAMGLTFPTYGADLEGWADGYCYIKSLALGDSTVTVIAGWDADDTKACVTKFNGGTTDFAGTL